VADPNAGMGIARDGGRLFVSNSRGQQHASYLQTGAARFVPGPGPGKAATAGWGASWIDVFNDGGSQLALANGSIPISNLGQNAQRTQLFSPGASDTFNDVGMLQSLRVDGRGLATADYDNDGRVDIAVNTIGGPLLLLRNESRAGNWLEVSIERFSPGAIVTVTLPGGSTQSHVVVAGSSYLSSEDPRVHFGLGAAKRVPLLTIRYPDGRVTRLRDVRANQILSLR
jgi:ASPIC and UnbV